VRVELGRIGVVAARFAPEAKFDVGNLEPPKAAESAATTDNTSNKTWKIVDGTIKGVVVGSVLGALIGMGVGAAACAPGGLLAAACAVAGLVSGLVYGAGGGAATGGFIGGAVTAYNEKTESPPTTTEATASPAGATAAKLPTGEELEASIKKVLSALELQEMVRDNVLQVGQTQTSRSLVVVNEHGPTVLGEKVSYWALADEDFDTVLELSVEELGWTDKKSNSISEPVAFFITIRARLVKILDDEDLYDHVYSYEGINGSLSDWDEQSLQVVINYAGHWLAERIVADVVARGA